MSKQYGAMYYTEEIDKIRMSMHMAQDSGQRELTVEECEILPILDKWAKLHVKDFIDNNT